MKIPDILIFLTFILFTSIVSAQSVNDGSVNSGDIPDFEEDFDYTTHLEKEIVGVWENVSMKVWVRSYNNSDTSFIVDINEDTWEMKMNIKPIVTTIHDDGTYISEFRNSFDSLIYKPKGTWMVDGDTLIMEDHQAVYRYQIFIDGDVAEFKSLIDWDKDGNADDKYSGVHRKKK